MIADARITNEALHSEGFIYSDTGVRPFSDNSDSTSGLLVIRPEQCQALGKTLPHTDVSGLNPDHSRTHAYSFPITAKDNASVSIK